MERMRVMIRSRILRRGAAQFCGGTMGRVGIGLE
jgi:hypothetical protein